METQTTTTASTLSNEVFQPGSLVIYAMHGKCAITAVESRTIGGESIQFYKLEVQRSTLSRSTRQEPAIWVPVNTARERGMRAPLNAEGVEAVMKILTSREYYFPLNESWSTLQPKLEAIIRLDGALGLAKVSSFLGVLKLKQIVPTPEVNRMAENVNRLLFREVSELTGESIKSLEEKAAKGLRQKLRPDV